MFDKLASAKPFLANATGGQDRYKAAQATAKELDNTAKDTDKRPGYVSVERNDGKDTFQATTTEDTSRWFRSIMKDSSASSSRFGHYIQ